MTKEEPETPNNSGTNQTDDLMQPQPQTSCVTTMQDFQSIIKTPSDEIELQSFNQINQSQQGNILGTGSSLLPPSPPRVHRKHGPNIRPSSIEDNRGDNRSRIVPFVKSTGPDSTDNRDIFEAGGDKSLNPSLNHPLGNFHSEGEEIECLPAETPETQVFTTPTASVEPDTLISWRTPVLLVKHYRKLFPKKLEKQIVKAPFFYPISMIVILFSAILIPGRESIADILICIIVYFVVCILITIALDRGQWSKSIEKLGETSLSGLCDRDSLCCGCFRRPDPEPERHSRYNHLEEEQDTAFEHEIADVSNMDPNDCPQIRIVEQHETLSPGSPDYPHDMSQVDVDVHVPGTTRNSEGGAISKHHGQNIYKKSAKSHCKTKSKSSSAPLNLAKSVKPNVHFPETVGNLKGMSRCKHPPQDVELGLPELSHIADASREKLKIFRKHLPKTGNVGTSVVRANPKEFICEHADQGLACSCSAHITEKNVESKNEFRTFNEEPSLLPKTDCADIITRSTESMNPDGIFSDSETSKRKPLQIFYKKGSQKSKENLSKLSDSPLKLSQTIHVDNDQPEASENPKKVSNEPDAQNTESEVPEFSE